MNTPVFKSIFFIINSYGMVVIPLLFGLSATFLFIYFYPRLDDRFFNNTGGYIDWMMKRFDQLFVKVQRRTCFILIVASTATLGLTGFFAFRGMGFLHFVGTVTLTYMGWQLPRVVLTVIWQRRLKKIDLQLTDALDLMSNSLKSGLNLLMIIQVVVRELHDPISQEFQLVLNQHHLGVSLDEALMNMAERVPTEDLVMTINAIIILRETGGNLSETFEVISNTIRERRKIEGKIKAVTAQGMTQSLILFLLPFGIALAMFLMNPDFFRPMISNKWGYLLIGLMLGLQAIGGLWLRKIVKINV